MNTVLRCICLTSAKCSKGKFYVLMTIERNKSLIHDSIIRYDISIVPILVGGISTDKEEFFGRLLAPYLAREDTLCVVSSDFCHW